MVEELFKQYAPIRSIYDTGDEYICFPETDTEPLAVYYDKKLNDYKEVYFFQDNTIIQDIEAAKLVYGEELDFSDEM